MSVVSLIRKPIERSCPDGCRIVAIVEAEAAHGSRREEVVASILIELGDPSGGLRSYGCYPILSAYSSAFLLRFLDSFACHPSYRARWRIDGAVDSRVHHPMRRVRIGSEFVDVDEAIADAVIALNASGYRTLYSCQGTDARYDATSRGRCVGYLVFRSGQDVPSDLASAARGAGFLVDEKSIHVYGRIATMHLGNQLFRTMLLDWAKRSLDESGRTYRPDPMGLYKTYTPYVPPVRDAPRGLSNKIVRLLIPRVMLSN